jgi:hypothetical protein
LNSNLYNFLKFAANLKLIRNRQTSQGHTGRFSTARLFTEHVPACTALVWPSCIGNTCSPRSLGPRCMWPKAPWCPGSVLLRRRARCVRVTTSLLRREHAADHGRPVRVFHAEEGGRATPFCVSQRGEEDGVSHRHGSKWLPTLGLMGEASARSSGKAVVLGWLRQPAQRRKER